jgi:hypothetical protein
MNSQEPRLKRVLGLWNLIILQVMAPVPIKGFLEKRSDGHAVTVVLAALV